MWQDLRHAVRVLRKNRGFVVMAALVLSLGIGLNTAIFSIVYAMLWKPLPVTSPNELVYIYQVFPRQPDRPAPLPTSYFDILRAHPDPFSGVTAHWGIGYSLNADDETDTVNAEWVFSNYFDVLGVKPALGRALVNSDDDPANPGHAIVISHALWARRFHSDPNIVGRNINLALWAASYTTWTVVGVMGPEFRGLSAPWTPTQVWMSFAQASNIRRIAVAPIARLKPGVTLQQARAIVAAQGHNAFFDDRGSPEREPRFVVYEAQSVRIPFDPSAAVIPTRLAGAMTIVVAMVLLVAATNIAGILMARGVGRTGELAVRRALGAGAVRIARQLLMESVLLALLGGLGGLVLAGWLVDLFRAWTPLQYAFEVSLNAQVAVFAATICIAAGILVGVFPVLQATRIDVLPALSGAGNLVTRQTKARVRHAITVPQVTVSLLLLLVAGMYVRALLQIELTDVGYQPTNLLVAQPALRSPLKAEPNRAQQANEREAARARRFYSQLLDRVRGLRGTEQVEVAVTDALPLNEPDARPNWSAVPQEEFLAGSRSGPGTERASVSPGYFQTMGMQVIAGRDFDERDTTNSVKVAVISASLARQLWPGRDAIGRTFTIMNAFPSQNEKIEWYEVAGLVNDVRPILQDRPTRPLAYFALSQQWWPNSYYVLVRAAGDSRVLIPSIKAAAVSADPLADMYRMRMMSQMIAEILYPRRIAAVILAVSGFVGLFLATLGVYSVVSYSVAQRTGEIGVRMALGAERRDIARLILREGRTVATLGSTAGLIFGYAAIKATSTRLALPRIDLATVIATPLVLAAAILLACYVPARRAGLVNPMEVLRRS